MKKNRPVTSFETEVYAATKRIPRGKVSTYKEVASAIGCGSSQAVGQALKWNPFAPEVPCHRVIRSDLTLGGFAGQVDGPEVLRKQSLLRREGVRITEGRLADPSQLHRFQTRKQ